jgi:hypothetical protein
MKQKGWRGFIGALKCLVRFFNRLDTPSFMPDMRVPLWKSLLIDWGRLFTFGLWKPNDRLDGQEGSEE